MDVSATLGKISARQQSILAESESFKYCTRADEGKALAGLSKMREGLDFWQEVHQKLTLDKLPTLNKNEDNSVEQVDVTGMLDYFASLKTYELSLSGHQFKKENDETQKQITTLTTNFSSFFPANLPN